MIWTLVFTQQAHKDAKKLASTHLKPKAQKLLDIIAKNPYQNPPPYEKLAKIFSAPEIAEATLLAGFYEMVACFLKTMGVKLDEHGLNWGKVDSESA